MRVGKMMGLAIISIFAGGCSSSNSGPSYGDETLGKTFTAVCRNMVTNCYVMASSKCKRNYDVINKVDVMRTSNARESFREYTVLYRCK
jgi:uncharacterized protein (DUF39 family)